VGSFGEHTKRAVPDDGRRAAMGHTFAAPPPRELVGETRLASSATSSCPSARDRAACRGALIAGTVELQRQRDVSRLH